MMIVSDFQPLSLVNPHNRKILTNKILLKAELKAYNESAVALKTA